jgi:glycosyltransferase involved in cell wall biosynthesis
VIRNGENGFVHTDLDTLVDAMTALLRDPAEARRLGEGARRTALERFHIDRFAQDWHDTLLNVTA